LYGSIDTTFVCTASYIRAAFAPRIISVCVHDEDFQNCHKVLYINANVRGNKALQKYVCAICITREHFVFLGIAKLLFMSEVVIPKFRAKWSFCSKSFTPSENAVVRALENS